MLPERYPKAAVGALPRLVGRLARTVERCSLEQRKKPDVRGLRGVANRKRNRLNRGNQRLFLYLRASGPSRGIRTAGRQPLSWMRT